MAMDQLPEDLLADVLRCLPPRVLAAARCVHSSWRAAVDARRLMDPPRLPLAGILINFQGREFTHLFACPPSPASSVATAKFLRRLPDWGCDVLVKDHCNGLLLLLGGYVVSPAARRWAVLPRPRRRDTKELFFRHYDYIAFDPAVSPHYEVFAVPEVPWSRGPRAAGWEWPPSPMLLHVYSSRTNRWEERSFRRQGEAFGTIADVPWSPMNQRRAVYWHGHLYVHHHFVMRISLLSGKYQVIKPPQGIITKAQEVPQQRLGKSEKGVYLASIASHRWLQVWILDEAHAPTEWVLKYETDLVLGRVQADLRYNPDAQGSWIIEDVNDNPPRDTSPDYKEQAKQENKDVLGTKDFYILGFHPHEEVLFLSESLQRGMAYHLSSSKFQYLGNMRPTRYHGFSEGYEFLRSSFPYTPCLTTEFPTDN
ncbi:uncharacterized protein [Triticum aestivum]|nr:uncharacterized protein LOC123038279 [Triticum aestivum]